MNTEQSGEHRGAPAGPGRCRMNLRRAVFMVMALFTLFALSPSAASGSGKKKKPAPPPFALIFGTVWTPQNRPAPGVHVKIRRSDEKKARWELLSNSQGEFAQRVPAGAGDYIVWAETKGHKGQAAETKVHVNGDERQDIGLHLTE